MVNIQGPNLNQIINQTVFSAMSNVKGDKGAVQAANAEVIYNLFFKDVKTKSEFKKKIRGTLKKLNNNLDETDIDGILDSLDMAEQPPFCASYSEEGVSQQLNLKDNLLRADIYDIFLMFYKRLYDEAGKKIS
ncbi:MAG: hypothetical protein PHV30_08055 [Candidatus Margulisbacteria bacterium]|nr:hypothetical protein [Candidatus Margulisiibacteriota bacterium]